MTMTTAVAAYKHLNQKYPKMMTTIKMLVAGAAATYLGPTAGSLVRSCLSGF